MHIKYSLTLNAIIIMSLLSKLSYAEEIKLNINVIPTPTLYYQGNVQAQQLTDTTTTLPIKKNGDTWLLPIKIGDDKLYMKVQLKLVGNPHVGYEMGEVVLQEPFYEKNAVFNLVLSPIKGQYDGRTVANLYKQDVLKMSPEKLMTFHQKARYAALKRIELMNDDWTKLHDYTVQAAYLFLQSSVRLANSVHLMPGKEAINVNEWLKQAVSINPQRVRHALSNEQYATTISQSIDNIAFIKLKKLWDNIVEIKDCAQRIPLLEQYRNTIVSYPEYRQASLVKTTGTNLKTVDLSLSQCLAHIVYNNSSDNSESISMISTQVKRLTTLQQKLKDDEQLYQQINSDLTVLKAISKRLSLR